MLFGRDNRVEEDLARIRRANLPPDQLAALEAKEASEREAFLKDKPGAKDIFAMILAVMSLVAPYALAFIGLLLLFGWGFGWIFGS